MREILFRGKRMPDGKWVEGNAMIPNPRFGGETCIISHDAPFNSFCYEVDPESVGQYTGLTDKNGKKIFEGDIIEFNNDFNKTKWRVVFGMNYGYGINSPCFILKDFRNATSPFNEKMVIIGNIYDNPELMEEK